METVQAQSSRWRCASALRLNRRGPDPVVRLLVLLSALAAALAMPGLAAAAPAWLAPGEVSKAGESAGLVAVAAKAGGPSVAVFENATTATVQVSARGVNDTAWPTPIDLSAPGNVASSPVVAVAASGFAVALWSRFDGANTIVQVSTRDVLTGGWSAPVDLSAAGADATSPAIALSDDRRAVAVWQRFDGATIRIQGSAYEPATGLWSSPADLSAAGEDATGPAVARKPNGDAVAVWLRPIGADDRVQASDYAASSATWSSPAELSAAGQDANNPRVATAPTGLTIALWQRSDGANTIIQASVQDPGVATWGAAFDLSSPLQNATRGQVALHDAGDAVALWQRSNGTNTIIQASVRPVASGIWQPVKDLSDPGQDAVRAQIAVDTAGTSTAAWQRSNGADTVIQAARMQGGGVWSGPVNVSGTGQDATDAAIVVDGEGGALSAWTRSDGANPRIQAAAFDAAGPVFSALTIPKKAAVGVKAAMSLSVADRWSAPVGEPSWDFGDGTTATGAAVAHPYKATGTYKVTVKQSDSVGNETSVTRKVSVRTSGGVSCTIVGTPGDDVLFGTAADDVICGLDGNDTLRGLQGDDLLLGGNGDDQLFGGQGNDVLRGQAGDDRLVGKAGDDRLQGATGSDRLNGNAGADVLAGGLGGDNLRGGLGDDIGRGKAGNDRLVGGPGDDRLFGQLGNDILLGQAGDDRLFGLAGDDVLVGGPGFDRATGGLGTDVCFAERRILC